MLVTMKEEREFFFSFDWSIPVDGPSLLLVFSAMDSVVRV